MKFFACSAFITAVWLSSAPVLAQTISAAEARSIDDEVGFAVLVWQFQTDAQRDEALYESIGPSGFHFDYSAEKSILHLPSQKVSNG